MARLKQMMSLLPRKRRPKGTGPRATKNTKKTLYRCDQCEYETSWPSWLRTHQRVHTGERPFKCHLCSYSSSQSSNLQQHLKRHSDERPFKCNICDYSCKRGHQLNTHRRTHFPKDLLLSMPTSPALNLDYPLSLDLSFSGVLPLSLPSSSISDKNLPMPTGIAGEGSASSNLGIEALVCKWKGVSNVSLRSVPSSNEDQGSENVKSENESSDNEIESPESLHIDEPSVS